MDKETKQEFNKIGGKFKKIDGEFKKIDGKFKKIDGEFKKIDGKFKKIDGEFNKIGSKFKKVDDRFNKIEIDLERMRFDLHKTLILMEDMSHKQDLMLEGFDSLKLHNEKSPTKEEQKEINKNHSIRISALEDELRSHI